MIGEPGELVITAPMPSMPVGLWGDDDGSRLRDDLLRPLPGHLAARRLDRLRARRQLRGHRPQRRDPQPRRRAARHRRVLPRRRGAARGRPTAWWSTSRTRPAATASCSSSWSPATGSAGRRAGRHHPLRPAHRALAPPRARPGHRGAGGAAQPDRQEAGAAGQADPPGRARRPRWSAGTPWPTPRRWTSFVALADERPGRGGRPMSTSPMRTVPGTVAVVGAGSIGGSWVALALARGLDRARQRPGAGCRAAAARRRRRPPPPSSMPRPAPSTGCTSTPTRPAPPSLPTWSSSPGRNGWTSSARSSPPWTRRRHPTSCWPAARRASVRAPSRTRAGTPSASSSRTRSTRRTWCRWSRSSADG